MTENDKLNRIYEDIEDLQAQVIATSILLEALISTVVLLDDEPRMYLNVIRQKIDSDLKQLPDSQILDKLQASVDITLGNLERLVLEKEN